MRTIDLPVTHEEMLVFGYTILEDDLYFNVREVSAMREVAVCADHDGGAAFTRSSAAWCFPLEPRAGNIETGPYASVASTGSYVGLYGDEALASADTVYVVTGVGAPPTWQPDDRNNPGIIMGCVAGGLAACCMGLAGIWVVLRTRPNNTRGPGSGKVGRAPDVTEEGHPAVDVYDRRLSHHHDDGDDEFSSDAGVPVDVPPSYEEVVSTEEEFDQRRPSQLASSFADSDA